MKILIIEDEPSLRETLCELLQMQGHEVLAAEDGVQGVALAAQSPDFIFCDVNMPNLDGHGALTKIKQMPGVCDVPFVFTTARNDREEVRAGMALGADDYITKPYSPSDILGALSARTKRQKGLREQIQQLSGHYQREIHAQWSHELLTPLNAVLGSLDLIEMQGESITRAQLKEMLGLIREGAERQERLARKLIHYFSLEQLLQKAPASTRDRGEADAGIALGAGRAAQRKKRERDLTLNAGPGQVAVTEQWLAIALEEIVENAFTFSAPGQPITVTGLARDGRYRITITDQGAGLSAEQRAHVGPFVQFDRKIREQQGLGLGLTIARLTARFAQGELHLQTGPDQRGLQVVLDLPLTRA